MRTLTKTLRTADGTTPLLTTDGTTDVGTPMLWDGNGEPVNGQPGARQPRGVYLFQWTLTDSLGVTDCDKSASLSITQTKSDLTGDYDPATDRNTTKDGCVLTDSATPRADASAANVQVYAGDTADMAAIDGFVPWTQTVAPTPLPSLTTNAPGASPPVWDEITFPEVIQMQEVHLFCAQDSHAATDRGGRSLWALQKNQKPIHPRADNYDAFLVLAKMDKLVANWQKWDGYASRANGQPTRILDVINRMPYDRFMHFSGRGGGEDYAQLFGGIEIPDSSAGTFQSHQRLFYYQPTAQPPKDYTWGTSSGFYFLLTQFALSSPGGPLPQPFSKLQIAVWEGCYTAYSVQGQGNIWDAGNLPDGTVALGARCAIGFNSVINYGTGSTSAHAIWANSFWQALTFGRNDPITNKPDGKPTNVTFAVNYATDQIGLTDPGNKGGYGSCRIAGDATTTVPSIK